MGTELTHEQMLDVLKQAFDSTDVELWDTGGGVKNPVVVLRRFSTGAAVRYALFSDGWSEREATVYLHDEGIDDSQPLSWWNEDDFAEEIWGTFPQSPSELRVLVLNLDYTASLERRRS